MGSSTTGAPILTGARGPGQLASTGVTESSILS